MLDLRTVLGVDSAGPGFSKVRIRPNLGPLLAAKGVVPHPKGLIRIEVTRENGVVKHKVTLPPGVAVVTPSVLVMLKSAWGLNVSVSVAALLPGVGSVTPPGAATVAVLDSMPVAAALIVALAV